MTGKKEFSIRWEVSVTILNYSSWSSSVLSENTRSRFGDDFDRLTPSTQIHGSFHHLPWRRFRSHCVLFVPINGGGIAFLPTTNATNREQYYLRAVWLVDRTASLPILNMVSSKKFEAFVTHWKDSTSGVK